MKKALWIISGWLSLCLLAEVRAAWTRVETPKFILYAEGNERTAISWAVELEQFRSSMDRVISVQPASLRPVTVMLFKSERSMRNYLPPWKGGAQLAGFFVQAVRHPFIALADTDTSEETRLYIFHEAVHWYLSARMHPLPLCIEEGVAELYSTFSVRKGRFSIGEPIAWHVGTIREKGMIPLDDFLSVTTRGEHFDEQKKATHFYAQAWLLAHYIFFREGGDEGKQLTMYLALRHQGVVIAEAVRRAFGCDLKQLQKRLTDYANAGSYVTMGGPVDRVAIERGVHTRVATPLEVDLALGTLLVASGNFEKGEAALLRVANRMPAEAVVWQALAESSVIRNEPAEAAHRYAKAVELGCNDARAFVTIAQGNGMKMGDLISIPAGKARESADLCLRALSVAENDKEASRLLASLAGLLEPVTAADSAALRQANLAYPDEPLIAIGLAAAELRTGKEAEGNARLETWLSRPGSLRPEETGYARHLLAIHRWEKFARELDRFTGKDDWKGAIAHIDATLQDDIFLPEQKKEMANRRITCLQAIRMQEFRVLMSERRFAEAVEMAQRLLDESVLPSTRPGLKQALALATAGLDLNRVSELIAKQNYTEARRLLTDIRGRALPPSLLREADNLLTRANRMEEAAAKRR